jgi:hypothetical protein
LKRCAAFISLFFFFLLHSHDVEANVDFCRRFFQKQRYQEAALCFLDLAQPQLERLAKEPALRISLGQSLKNAALSYKKAAEQTTEMMEAAYLREQGVKQLEIYLLHKCYETPNQRRAAEVLREGLSHQIGYGNLTIQTGDQKAQIEIKGFRFQHQAIGEWRGALRPGNYAIAISYPQESPQSKGIFLAPFQPQIVVFQPLSSPFSRALPWIWIGSGIGATILGIVFSGIAFSTREQRDRFFASIHQEGAPPPKYSDTQELLRLHREANAFLLRSMITGGVGLSAIVLGSILFARLPKQSAPTTAATPLPPTSQPKRQRPSSQPFPSSQRLFSSPPF